MRFGKLRIKGLLKKQVVAKFAVFSFLILLGFFLGANMEEFQRLPSESISAKELKKALSNNDLTLINVHTPYEGEIEATDMFIEYDSMIANKDRLPEAKDAPIILYCKSGRMSAQALQTLKDMGYTNVGHLTGGMNAWEKAGYELLDLSKLPDEVTPEDGISLPVNWGDIGPRLVRLGVIDLAKFEEIMQLKDEEKEVLTKGLDAPIKITPENSRFVVNMLWALGLAQKSLVYEEGPMGKEYKDKIGNFASTAGWTLARKDAVDYLNRYELIPLDSEQQRKVSEIAKNVYRPCCGNNTAFPDCNHGMAALAAIELLVSANVPEEEIYKYILGLNSFWFPDTYLTIATYFARQGNSWDSLDAKMVLGEEFSSAQKVGEIYTKVGPLPYGGLTGGSCGA